MHAEAASRVRHPDVDVQPADALAPRRRARVLDEVAVTLDRRDLLLGRIARRIRAGGRDARARSAAAISRAARRSSHEPLDAPRPPCRSTSVVELDDRRVQLRLQHAGKLAALRAGDELLDARARARASPRRGSRAPPRRRPSSARPKCCSITWRGRRGRGRRPPPTRSTRRSARTTRSYASIRGLRPTSFARCAWWRRFGSSRCSQTRIRCAAVMNSATNVQPDAGQGNGFGADAEPAAVVAAVVVLPELLVLDRAPRRRASALARLDPPLLHRDRLPVRRRLRFGHSRTGVRAARSRSRSRAGAGRASCAPTRAPSTAPSSRGTRGATPPLLSASRRPRSASRSARWCGASARHTSCSRRTRTRCSSKRFARPTTASPSRYAVTSSTSSRQFRWASTDAHVSSDRYSSSAFRTFARAAVKQHALICLGKLESVTDLVCAPPLDVAQRDDGPLRLWEPFDRVFDHRERLTGEELVLGPAPAADGPSDPCR